MTDLEKELEKPERMFQKQLYAIASKNERMIYESFFNMGIIKAMRDDTPLSQREAKEIDIQNG